MEVAIAHVPRRLVAFKFTAWHGDDTALLDRLAADEPWTSLERIDGLWVYAARIDATWALALECKAYDPEGAVRLVDGLVQVYRKQQSPADVAAALLVSRPLMDMHAREVAVQLCKDMIETLGHFGSTLAIQTAAKGGRVHFVGGSAASLSRALVIIALDQQWSSYWALGPISASAQRMLGRLPSFVSCSPRDSVDCDLLVNENRIVDQGMRAAQQQVDSNLLMALKLFAQAVRSLEELVAEVRKVK